MVRWLALAIILFASGAHADATLGLLSELTGPSAANGEACRQGYEVARQKFAPNDVIGAQKIRFLFGDHKAEAKTAIDEYNRFVKQEDALAVLSNRGNVGMALDPLSKQDNVPLIGMMAHINFIDQNPNGFRFWPSAKTEGAALAQRAYSRGLRKVASLILEDDAALAIGNSFEGEFKRLGGEVVFHELVGEKDTDFSTLFSRARGLKPDLLFIHVAVTQMGIAVKRARELGLKQPIYSYFWIGYPEVLQSAGKDALEGTTFISLATDRPLFKKEFEKQFPDQKVVAVTYACFAGLAFALQEIEQNSKDLTREKFLKLLKVSHKVELPDETLKIENREVLFPLEYRVIRDGQVTSDGEISASPLSDRKS